MWRHLAIALRLALTTLVIFGVIYPLAITGLAQLMFPKQANGSLIEADGRVIGSAMIGQSFTGAEYFHPRPSAAGAGYDAAASGGSNLGPTSKALLKRVRQDLLALIEENPGLRRGGIPIDMLTTSGSGLDPDITPVNAYAQAPRVAAARHMSRAAVVRIIDRNLTRRQFGILGEPRVNVLKINMALDAAAKVGESD